MFGCALVFFLSAYAFAYFNSISYPDALWLAFITASTVGYGDIPISDRGQIWAVVHTFVSVSETPHRLPCPKAHRPSCR